MKPRFRPVLLCVLVSVNAATLPLAKAEEVATSTTATTAVATISASSPTTDSPNAARLNNRQAITQTRNQIWQIVFAEDFSKKAQNKHWQRKHLPNLPELKWQKPNQMPRPSAELVGLILKIMALLALLVGVVWIAKNAQTWLAWFKWSKQRRAHSQPNADITSHYRQAFAPIWQGLPEKARLSQFVREAVASGDWLLALSTLYRGTLREMVDIYDLPITRATTERQGEWLLQQAKANHPESTFFQQLIQIWANVAYGQQRPNQQQVASFSQEIHQLASAWDSLYLHRQSYLEKRYQQLEPNPNKAKAKRVGGHG